MTPRSLVAVTAVAAAGVVGHAGPAVWAVGPVRRVLRPRLAGRGRPGHVALTFDDGPDPAGTPAVLDVLARYRVTATFFVLGRMLRRNPHLGAEMLAAGHELAVHGWDHTLLLLRGRAAVACDIRRTRDLIAETGGAPRWYRPPYGTAAGGTFPAARAAGLVPVAWTAWGRDWSARSTPASVVRAVRRRPAGGATVLLHDSDCTSAPGSWRTTVAALPILLDGWLAAGLEVGPLREHGLRPGRDTAGRVDADAR